MTSFSIAIGNRRIGPDEPVFIVAEAGVNHDGSLERALRLVDAAREAGADAVKFQTFSADRLVARDAAGLLTPYEMLKRLELPPDAFRTIRDRAREKGIGFFSTPFDLESLDLLLELDVPAVKIGSGDITFLPLIEAVATSARPALLSCGASEIAHVRRAVEAFRAAGGRDLCVLHCVSKYPPDLDELNLRTIPFLADTFDGIPIGFSDHSLDHQSVPAAAALAVACGACVVEKHLTLDNGGEGPDHRASLNPVDFKWMVDCVRTAEQALGRKGKLFPEGEGVQRAIRRGIYAIGDIRAGELISLENMDFKRPVGSIPAEDYRQVVGRSSRRDIPDGSPIAREDLV